MTSSRARRTPPGQMCVSKHDEARGLRMEVVTTFERVLDETTGGSVRALLSTLTERERQVLRWRFGFDGDELSLREIGRRLGMSGERVRQIEQRALAKLRAVALPPHDGVDTGAPSLT